MDSGRVEYKALVRRVEEMENSGKRQDTEEYQTGVTKLIEEVLRVKQVVYDRLSLFSDNEEIEDVSTSSIPFLSIDYYLGRLVLMKQYVGVESSEDPVMKYRWKIEFLNKAVQIWMQFLVTLQGYGVSDEFLSKVLDRVESSQGPLLEELFPQPSSSEDLTGAQMKRQAKIDIYQQNKLLEQKIGQLKVEMRGHEVEHNDRSVDEEVLRKLYLAQLKQLSFKCFNELEGILMEIELLKNFSKAAPIQEPSKDKEEKLLPFEYTDKLETLNKPLLSKNGRVLRNFTLLDKKDRLKESVFGYGQYGPTMSVEEFLEQEFESGRVLQDNKEPEEVVDEDNHEWQDKETYKAREWDAFKEANLRGSGNTMNRG
ncbi:Tap42p Ecym_4565 [Eremothecium cymbalariae DBVPG|uniref:Type 2A phosphatase-associated protein 42 n=1 Tax=Eremothecium cymbalariae (strain CBS 270.75 / DBVPG 7215 / KCTC 17166 / NRRL Y-17582) TaxID=931890 RepID=G8JS76_ERECY|nr:hypothetical protein Ecym_4565 [Eremothecium cymbalariae DBVPG\